MDEQKRVRAERFGITTAEMVAEREAAQLADRVSPLAPHGLLFNTLFASLFYCAFRSAPCL